MGVHTSLAPVYGYSLRGERLRLKVPRNRGKNTTLLASITLLGGMGETMAVEGSTDRGVFEAYLESTPLHPPPAGRTGGDHGQPSRPQAQEGEGADRGEGLRANLPTRLLSGPQPDRRSVQQDQGPSTASGSPYEGGLAG